MSRRGMGGDGGGKGKKYEEKYTKEEMLHRDQNSTNNAEFLRGLTWLRNPDSTENAETKCILQLLVNSILAENTMDMRMAVRLRW